MRHRSCGVAWVLAVIACGPRVIVSTEGDDATTSTSNGTSEAGTSEAGTRASSESSSATTAVPIDCALYEDEGPEGNLFVWIEIRNGTDAPLLLDAPCFNYDYISMWTESGWRWPSEFCTQTCTGQFVDGCYACDGCAESAYTILMPGARTEVYWPGVMYEPVSPPDACFAYGSCGDTCPRARVSFPEWVHLEVAAISYAQCIEHEDPDVCTCPEPETYTCESFGSARIEPTLLSSTYFDDEVVPERLVMEFLRQ